jgi:hypothetical protein
LETKFAELQAKLLGDHHLLGQAIGVPFLLLLYPPPEEVMVRREAAHLAAVVRERGVQITEIDCAALVLETIEARGELERIIQAERRDAAVLRELALGPVIADALISRVTTAARAMTRPCAVFLNRLAGMYPFASPPMLQERLAGTVMIPVVFFVPAEPLDESHYLFVGSEKTLRYRGVYL